MHHKSTVAYGTVINRVPEDYYNGDEKEDRDESEFVAESMSSNVTTLAAYVPPTNTPSPVQVPFPLDTSLTWEAIALLTGCSAGGLATILHCDKFRALIATTARVKCFSDGGYFLHALGNPSSKGWFINSCFAHCQSVSGSSWLGPNVTLNHKVWQGKSKAFSRQRARGRQDGIGCNGLRRIDQALVKSSQNADLRNFLEA
ncbi:hypothetical protein LguiB_009569 [Lonicera macranthoides]